MRSTLRAGLVLMVSCLAACEASAPLGSKIVQARPDAGADPVAAPDAAAEAASPSGGGPVNAADAAKMMVAEMDAAIAVAAQPPPDAEAKDSAPDVAPTEAGDSVAGRMEIGGEAVGEPVLIGCAALAAGGKPDRLKDMLWQYEVGPTDTGFNRPYDSVKIDNGCAMTYLRQILPRPPAPQPTSVTKTATMNATDCADARGWLTNSRFIEVLQTGDHCPFGNGNPGDVFDLTLTDIGRVARKTYLCPEPTVEAVRACLRPLVARLFSN